MIREESLDKRAGSQQLDEKMLNLSCKKHNRTTTVSHLSPLALNPSPKNDKIPKSSSSRSLNPRRRITQDFPSFRPRPRRRWSIPDLFFTAGSFLSEPAAVPSVSCRRSRNPTPRGQQPVDGLGDTKHFTKKTCQL